MARMVCQAGAAFRILAARPWRPLSCHNEGMRLIFAILSAACLLAAADVKLGKPLALKEPVAIATLLAHPDDYAGKTVQVKGRIAAVCQMMGCWMDIANEYGRQVHVKVKDGEIVFPKDSPGKLATVEGTFSKTVLTREEAVERAREEAKDKGKAFDASSVKSGVTVYEIAGFGAVIAEK